MTAPKNSPTKPRKEPPRNLILIDFHEHELERALEGLLDMARKGQIDGLIFSARMSHKGEEPYLHGCEGRLLDNPAEAIGAAVLLQHELVNVLLPPTA